MSIEERLVRVEQELAQLERRLDLVSKPADLLLRVGGSMAAFPELEEVARLGREIRKTDAQDPFREPS